MCRKHRPLPAAVGALEIKAQIDGALASPDVSEQQVVSCVKSPSYTSGSTGAAGSCTITSSSKPPPGEAPASPRCQSCLLALHHCLQARRLQAAPTLTLTELSAHCQAGEKDAPFGGVDGGTVLADRRHARHQCPAGSIKVSPAPGFYSLSPSPSAIMLALANMGPVVSYFSVEVGAHAAQRGIRLHAHAAVNAAAPCPIAIPLPGNSLLHILPPQPPSIEGGGQAAGTVMQCTTADRCPQLLGPLQSSFYSYTSGVVQAPSCTTNSINHALVIGEPLLAPPLPCLAAIIAPCATLPCGMGDGSAVW